MRVTRSDQRESPRPDSMSRVSRAASFGNATRVAGIRPVARRRKVSGRNTTSSLSPVMKIRHSSAVSMRLARPAAKNAPELTPT
jgi:hypothetical protein